jgi:DNA-binding SARP family transcriptional activator
MSETEIENSASELCIRCFGRFEVSRGAIPIRHWRRDRARVLLHYLVLQRRAVSRDEILDLLWTGVDRLAAARNLRVVLHALRQAVGTWGEPPTRDFVVVEGDQVLLHPSAPIWIDTDAFLEHLATAAALEQQALYDQAMQEYHAAERLYRADYLVDEVADQTVLLRREQLKDGYLRVLVKLADWYQAHGESARIRLLRRRITSLAEV